MTLLPPNADQLEAMRQEFDPEPSSVAQDISHLKEWLNKQQHLPKIDDDVWLGRFLRGCKFSMQRTKEVLDMYFMVRGTVPDFFRNRDPTNPDTRRSAEQMFFYPLPTLSPEGCRVLVSKLADETETESYSPTEYMRRTLMVGDVRLQEEPQNRGDILIFDFADFTLSHLVNYTIPLAKKYVVCGKDALPFRLRQVHFINSPAFADKFLAFFKPFLKDKIKQRILLHSKNHESLYEHMPRDILPTEYGGKAGTHRELTDAWQKKIESYRDWFLVEEKNRMNDIKKRPDKTIQVGELLGMDGSFKQLAID